MKDENRRRKRRLAVWRERWGVAEGGKVHAVKRGQVSLTPVPGVTWWDQCPMLRLSQTASNLV